MIHIFTDFGYAGPYVGELKTVLMRNDPGNPPVDLMHDAPSYNPRASAYLLEALARRFKTGDGCLAIIDPGVGDASRRPVLVEADGIVYCAPDNGLLSQVIRHAGQTSCYEILWRPEQLSNSFHGRDLFAPALQKFLAGEREDIRELACNELIGQDWPDRLDEIIYIDGFGNAVTGISGTQLDEQQHLQIGTQRLVFAPTFAAVATGQAFWYVNSMGLVEIAANQSSAARQLGLEIGSPITCLV